MITINAQDQDEKVNSSLNSLANKTFNETNNDAAIALVSNAAINTQTMNETAALPMEIFPTSVSNVNEEAKNNMEAIITPIQVQYSNIDFSYWV